MEEIVRRPLRSADFLGAVRDPRPEGPSLYGPGVKIRLITSSVPPQGLLFTSISAGRV